MGNGSTSLRLLIRQPWPLQQEEIRGSDALGETHKRNGKGNLGSSYEAGGFSFTNVGVTSAATNLSEQLVGM